MHACYPLHHLHLAKSAKSVMSCSQGSFVICIKKILRSNIITALSLLKNVLCRIVVLSEMFFFSVLDRMTTRGHGRREGLVVFFFCVNRACQQKSKICHSSDADS